MDKNTKKAQNTTNQFTNQSLEQYILRGPQHFEEKVLDEFSLSYDNQIKDFNKAYQCYAYYRNKGYEHSLAWDKCGCHTLTLELQLQLRAKIKEIEKDLNKEASANIDYKYAQSLFPQEIAKDVEYSKNLFKDDIDVRLRKLASFIDDENIIKEVLLEQKDIFSLKVACDEKSNHNDIINNLSKEINVLYVSKANNNTLEILAKKPSIHKVNVKTAGRFSNRKICIIGFPSESRTKICERLAAFYDVEFLNPFSIFEKAVEMGIFDDEEFKQNKENLLDLPSELVNFAYSAIENHLNGFIIEGFPVTVEHLDNLNVDAIIFLDSDLDKMLKLKSNRKWCPVCERLYHMIINPPMKKTEKGDICDRCGTDLIIRPEDKSSYIKNQYYNWRTSYNDLMKKLKTKENFLHLKDQEDVEKMVVEIHRFVKKVKK